MGDECTDSYYLCPVCGVYTKASWWDNFTGVETMNLSGPIAEQEGKERIEIIRKCFRPWAKKYRFGLQAHHEHRRDNQHYLSDKRRR